MSLEPPKCCSLVEALLSMDFKTVLPQVGSGAGHQLPTSAPPTKHASAMLSTFEAEIIPHTSHF